MMAAPQPLGLVALADRIELWPTARLRDNEIDALLIDEPETSLHPQLQAFLLREIENVMVDPLVDQSKR